MSTITTKTTNWRDAGSGARVVAEICDSQGFCCQTASLDNPGEDRQSGQTDVYTDAAILGNCAQKVVYIWRKVINILKCADISLF